MIVKKTSLFPASQETVYEKIRRPETLRLVAAPYASFEPWGRRAAYGKMEAHPPGGSG